MDFKDTSEIKIPKDPFEQIIGQDEAVKIARMIPTQRRHLLLVGPPGTGKSMIAKAISSILPFPKYEVSIFPNESNPERPLLQITEGTQPIKREIIGKTVHPSTIPIFASEILGFRCRRCSELSNPRQLFCSHCGAEKQFPRNPMENMINEKKEAPRIEATVKGEIITYELTNEDKILELTEDDIKKRKQLKLKYERKILVPLKRSLFVQATGANETELLGDIKHDPYGDHPDLSTAPHTRIIPGSVHEAHEGVLFIDELSTLGEIQRYLLTAMQEKKYPIIGRNPSSSGASVRVDNVPCDFIFVGALNISDLQGLMPPLRSRIRGQGYEILVNSYMDDNKENRNKLVQFIAQEVEKDSRIPHACKAAVLEIIKESKKIAKEIDNKDGLTLRLRNLSGLLRLAGDLAHSEHSKLIEKPHIISAKKLAKPIEDQLNDRYDSGWKAGLADQGIKPSKNGSEVI